MKTLSLPRFVVAVALAATCAISSAVAAHADGTSGSYCSQSGTVNATGTKVDGNVTYQATVSYTRLMTCGGTTIGYHIFSVTASYSGGFNGTGRSNSKHGMTEIGLNYMRPGEGAGDQPYAGSVISVAGFPRSQTFRVNRDLYSGTGHYDGKSWSFSDLSVYARYQDPHNDFPNINDNVLWYRFASNTWVEYEV